MTQQITLMIHPPLIVQLKPPAFHIFPQFLFLFHIFHTNMLGLARRNAVGILDLKNSYQANVSAIVIFIAIDLAIVI